jgi:hypothetical protein
MKKAILTTVLGISLSAAWAVDWDDNDDFTLLTDEGIVVGQGELDDGSLELALVSGYTGFVRFEAGGEMVEGMVNPDGTITLYNTNGFVELDDDLSSKGYSLTVTPVDSIAAPASVVVTPTDPNRDDDTDDDSTSGVLGSNDDGNRDDDDDGNNDTSSSPGNSDDDDMNGDDSSSSNDDDDNSSSSGSNNTSSDDDNDDDDNDDGSDNSSGSTDTSSDDDSDDDDSDDN